MPTESDFVHLHLHSEYSLLDGACRIESLLKRVRELRMDAVAVTDHGNMFGALDFYLKARKAEVKPIIGMEAYVAPGSRFEKRGGASESNNHLVLLAENSTGYRNLMKLSSIGFLEGFYYKPRVDKEVLAKHHEGVIAMTACLAGEVGTLALKDELARAKTALGELVDIFGKDNFFVELMDDGMPEQKRANPILARLAKDAGVGIVATNDCHYLKKSDARAHDVLLCIQTGTFIDEPKRLKMPTDEFYLKSIEEMTELFQKWPEAVRNTRLIADRCNVEIDLDQQLIPHFHPPERMSPREFLHKLAREGVERRYGNITPEIEHRLAHELEVIDTTGYVNYFLVVWDFIHYAKECGIPVGPGRGSAAGSIVSYALGITGLDPLKYGLQFERFLNPERVSSPDIDIDFCYVRRGEIIDYVRRKYGRDNVAQIITFGTMGARQAIRDVGRVLRIPYGRTDAIAKLIPEEINITLEDAMLKEPELKRLTEEDPQVKELWQIALALEGMVRHASIHAAGIVICEQPLTEFVPVYLAKGDEGEAIATQYDMDGVAQIGLLKMDFLGLRTLTVIVDTVRLIKTTRSVEIDMDNLPLDDVDTYELLNSAETFGVFQLESSGMRDLIRKADLKCFEDICALVALFRPGPMNMLEDYIQRKRGKIPVEYDHPLLENILKETYGIMLYQEQVIRIASELGGFSLGQADVLRRAMGKKIPEEMARNREAFVDGAVKRGIAVEVADRIFDNMARFAGYGFNKSHSAAYALIAYQTAYLKANYPVEYMASLLTSEIGKSAKIKQYVDESKRMKIEILPPDVNLGQDRFTVADGRIRFALCAVKNVGEGAARLLVEEREKNGDYADLFDLCKRIDLRTVNRKVLESLIKSGAFDFTSARRSRLMEALDTAMQQGQLSQKEREVGQISLFDSLGSTATMKHTSVQLPDIEEWPDSKKLGHEKEVLGFYLSGHPLQRHATTVERFASVSLGQLPNEQDGSEAIVGGMIVDVKQTLTKRGDRMAYVTLEDLSDVAEITVFPDLYEQTKELLLEDAAVMVKGRVSFRDNVAKVIAAEIFDITDAAHRLTTVVHVRLSAAAATEEHLQKLQRIVKANPGQCGLVIHCQTLKDSEVVIQAYPGYRVAPSEKLLREASEFIGPDAIWFSAHNGPVVRRRTAELASAAL